MRYFDLVPAETDDMIAVSEKVKKKKQKKSKSRSPHLVDKSVDSAEKVTASSMEMDKPVPFKESVSSSSSRLSLDSVSDDGQAPLYVALTASTDLVSGEARAAADATALVLSASSAPISADQHLLSSSPPTSTAIQQDSSPTSPPSEQLPQDPPSSPPHLHSVSPPTHPEDSDCQGSEGSMRTAMLSLSKMKDDIELQNR